ncbi:MAG TPA: hypothetical protein VMT98_04830, partial [Verrucomicrobiae bacterium]|nr:hypothetical protein [Verrucomicrobiae bacterium]
IPVNVRGTLASPSVTPDPAGLVKGATGALAGTAEGGDTVGALAGLVTGAAGGGTAQPAPASGSGCGAVAAAAPAATTEPAQPAAATTSPTDQLIQQGTEKTKEGVGDALKGLLGD